MRAVTRGYGVVVFVVGAAGIEPATLSLEG